MDGSGDGKWWWELLRLFVAVMSICNCDGGVTLPGWVQVIAASKRLQEQCRRPGVNERCGRRGLIDVICSDRYGTTDRCPDNQEQ